MKSVKEIKAELKKLENEYWKINEKWKAINQYDFVGQEMLQSNQSNLASRLLLLKWILSE